MKLDDLMNASLDDLADLPTFEAPPEGAYTLDLTISTKKVNGKDSVSFDYVVKGVMELADPTGKQPEVGQKFNELFQLENDIGVGKLKESCNPLFAHFGIDPKVKGAYKELFAKSKNISVFGVVKHRPYTKDGESRIGVSVLNLKVL